MEIVLQMAVVLLVGAANMLLKVVEFILQLLILHFILKFNCFTNE